MYNFLSLLISSAKGCIIYLSALAGLAALSFALVGVRVQPLSFVGFSGGSLYDIALANLVICSSCAGVMVISMFSSGDALPVLCPW